MPVLETNLDPRGQSYMDNRGAMLQRLSELDTALGSARCDTALVGANPIGPPGRAASSSAE